MSGPWPHTHGIWAPFSWPVHSPSEDLGARTAGLPLLPPEKMSLVWKHCWPQKYYWTKKKEGIIIWFFDFSFIKCNIKIHWLIKLHEAFFSKKINHFKSVSACLFSLTLSFKNNKKQLLINYPFRIDAYTF